MRIFVFIILSCFLLIQGCKNGNMYDKETAMLDSTKIVLQVKLNELKKSEQSMQNFQFPKFDAYYSFLKANVKDTIGRVDANALQAFVNSGTTLKEFNKGKAELIKQTETSITQLQKLSADIKQNNIQNNVLRSYCNSEKGHAEELIKVIEQNIRALNLSLNAYKNSLNRTEEYIKQINNGQLPMLVADSTLE
jgi:hypothetical protein